MSRNNTAPASGTPRRDKNGTDRSQSKPMLTENPTPAGTSGKGSGSRKSVGNYPSA